MGDVEKNVHFHGMKIQSHERNILSIFEKCPRCAHLGEMLRDVNEIVGCDLDENIDVQRIKSRVP